MLHTCRLSCLCKQGLACQDGARVEVTEREQALTHLFGMDYSGPFMIEARKPPPDPVTLQLVVSAEDTVATLKGRLASQREDWSSEQMNVILQGKFLQDPQTMAECELKNGDFVVITGMVARDFRRPAQEEAELRREGEGEEGTPFFAPPAVVNLPTDNQSIERT